MNKISQSIGIILLVIAIPVLCVAHLITPTFGRQIPFNEWAWKHYPVQKIRWEPILILLRRQGRP